MKIKGRDLWYEDEFLKICHKILKTATCDNELFIDTNIVKLILCARNDNNSYFYKEYFPSDIFKIIYKLIEKNFENELSQLLKTLNTDKILIIDDNHYFYGREILRINNYLLTLRIADPDTTPRRIFELSNGLIQYIIELQKSFVLIKRNDKIYIHKIKY